MRTRLVGFLSSPGWLSSARPSRVSTPTGARTQRLALEVPPRATTAQSQAIFHLSDDASELQYKLIASNIENVVASHIHVGASGVNGPIVAFLYGTAAPGAGRTDGVRRGHDHGCESSGRSRERASPI